MPDPAISVYIACVIFRRGKYLRLIRPIAEVGFLSLISTVLPGHLCMYFILRINLISVYLVFSFFSLFSHLSLNHSSLFCLHVYRISLYIAQYFAPNFGIFFLTYFG